MARAMAGARMIWDLGWRRWRLQLPRLKTVKRGDGVTMFMYGETRASVGTMAFDDLARHMAKRDGKQAPSGDAQQILADAARADQRMSRSRDLILGPIMMVGGLLILGLYIFYLYGVFTNPPLQDIHEGPGGKPVVTYYYSIPLPIITGGMAVLGCLRTIRGIRGRSR